MSRENDDAICLRETEWSETSQVAVLLTRHHGLIRGLAKGSRRTGSRFDAGIEPLTIGEVGFILDPRKDLLTLTAWSTTRYPLAPRRGLLGFAAGVLIADVARTLLAPLDHHPGAFPAQALDALESPEPHNTVQSALHAAAVTVRALVRLLRAAGFEIDLPNAHPREVLRFNPADGAFQPAGRAHQSAPDTAWKVRGRTVAFLKDDPTATFDTDDAERAVRFLLAWIADRVGRTPEAGEFLCRLLRRKPGETVGHPPALQKPPMPTPPRADTTHQ
jgi:recombinational DNA repair protein (RecF pathway)